MSNQQDMSQVERVVEILALSNLPQTPIFPLEDTMRNLVAAARSPETHREIAVLMNSHPNPAVRSMLHGVLRGANAAAPVEVAQSEGLRNSIDRSRLPDHEEFFRDLREKATNPVIAASLIDWLRGKSESCYEEALRVAKILREAAPKGVLDRALQEVERAGPDNSIEGRTNIQWLPYALRIDSTEELGRLQLALLMKAPSLDGSFEAAVVSTIAQSKLPGSLEFLARLLQLGERLPPKMLGAIGDGLRQTKDATLREELFAIATSGLIDGVWKLTRHSRGGIKGRLTNVLNLLSDPKTVWDRRVATAIAIADCWPDLTKQIFAQAKISSPACRVSSWLEIYALEQIKRWDGSKSRI